MKNVRTPVDQLYVYLLIENINHKQLAEEEEKYEDVDSSVNCVEKMEC